ncbi:MAG: malate dehydrogenase [Opitutaceae bacterium]|nr:malate dehydrogenase [Opitutaceae bacterium]|tara:strand:- start:5684 stop:7252 length:1569 start_codon:yes stop_codon:yes gene_type:complete
MENMKHPLDAEYYLPPDQFFQQNAPTGLTYDDVSLATRYSEILPRQTNLETKLSESLTLQIPILSADMDTVTEAEMAVAMSLNGGMGIIHFNMDNKNQVKQVARVKHHIHGLIQEPVTISPDKQVGDVLNIIAQKNFNFRTFPVIKDNGKLMGLLSGSVVRERYRDIAATKAMTPREQLYTLNESNLGDDPIAAADKFFDENIGIHKILVVDDEDNLKGLFTLSDVEQITSEKTSQLKPSRDSNFRLLVGAAVSAMRKKDGAIDRSATLDHIENLVEENVDAIAVSSAHAHTLGMGQVVKLIREAFPDMTIIAGNVSSAAGVQFLAGCGANAVKVGQGPGSICTTRLVAGVGIPQLTAIYVACKEAEKMGVKIVADGGITKSGDMVKALTMADAVMLGSLLAGCRESPGEIIEINGHVYKQYRGMGSHAAMKEGSAARYGHEKANIGMKVAAEGIEALKELSGPIDKILGDYVGGIQSGMGYLGAPTIADLHRRARFMRISQAGQRESTAHDVIEIKAPKEN